MALNGNAYWEIGDDTFRSGTGHNIRAKYITSMYESRSTEFKPECKRIARHLNF